MKIQIVEKLVCPDCHGELMLSTGKKAEKSKSSKRWRFNPEGR